MDMIILLKAKVFELRATIQALRQYPFNPDCDVKAGVLDTVVRKLDEEITSLEKKEQDQVESDDW